MGCGAAGSGGKTLSVRGQSVALIRYGSAPIVSAGATDTNKLQQLSAEQDPLLPDKLVHTFKMPEKGVAWRLLEPQPPRLEVHIDGSTGVTVNVLLSEPSAFTAGGTYIVRTPDRQLVCWILHRNHDLFGRWAVYLGGEDRRHRGVCHPTWLRPCLASSSSDAACWFPHRCRVKACPRHIFGVNRSWPCCLRCTISFCLLIGNASKVCKHFIISKMGLNRQLQHSCSVARRQTKRHSYRSCVGRS
eukprot:SAG31_NODE_3784_length_3883_cov_1.859672_3_plen_245_part_00